MLIHLLQETVVIYKDNQFNQMCITKPGASQDHVQVNITHPCLILTEHREDTCLLKL